VKYAELRRQAEEARREAASLKQELKITRSIQMIQLGEVRRGVAVEFRIRQRVEEVQYVINADRPGFKASIEIEGVKSLMREIVRNGFVSARSELDVLTHEQLVDYSIFVVRP
jgi:hypothetical protein